jgi:hypothetical protein
MASVDTLNLATCSVDMRFLPEDVDRAVRLLLSVKVDIIAKRGYRVCDVSTESPVPLTQVVFLHWADPTENRLDYRSGLQHLGITNAGITWESSCGSRARDK